MSICITISTVFKFKLLRYNFKDKQGETTEKHGRWRYYDRTGQLEEERNYYKDMLYGKTTVYFPNKKLRREGYFKFNRQDSIFREYYESGKLMTEGEYILDQPVGIHGSTIT